MANQLNNFESDQARQSIINNDNLNSNQPVNEMHCDNMPCDSAESEYDSEGDNISEYESGAMMMIIF